MTRDSAMRWIHGSVVLQKDPARRFQHTADAAVALRELGDLVEGSPGEFGGRARDPPTRPVPTYSPLSELPTSQVPVSALRAQSPEEETTRIPRAEEPPAGEAASIGVQAPARPALGTDWSTTRARPTLPRLLGTGLGLYGLRSVPLVDRETERHALWSALREVEADGLPRAVVLVGAAGTGKSRLAEWLCERAYEAGGCAALRASHSPEGGQADGIGPMIRRHLACVGLAGPDACAASTGDWADWDNRIAELGATPAASRTTGPDTVRLLLRASALAVAAGQTERAAAARSRT